MLFGPNLVGQWCEPDLDLLADVFPVRTCVTELSWLGAFPAIRFSDAYCLNARVFERENNVDRCHFPHGFVERIARFVCIGFGRPKISTRNFMTVCLVLVYPPVAHRLPSTKRCHPSNYFLLPRKATLATQSSRFVDRCWQDLASVIVFSQMLAKRQTPQTGHWLVTLAAIEMPSSRDLCETA